jgi:RimJ/RimL family protein N-acetyltransferase
MEEFKENVIYTFNGYKCKSKFDDLRCIPIYNDLENLIGFLKPITFHYKLISPECVSLISKWRKENPIAFATIFEVTNQRTEYWLNNLLLLREDRILFMIESLNGESLGHLGFSSFNFEEKSCEIDNVVRGVKQTHKGLMSFAMESIVHWGEKALNLTDIYLRVLSDNFHAIKFYENLGFSILYNIPLYKDIQSEETKWIEVKKSEDIEPDRSYAFMKLVKK